MVLGQGTVKGVEIALMVVEDGFVFEVLGVEVENGLRRGRG